MKYGNYYYILENDRGMPVYNTCPGCGNEKTFHRYIESETRVQVSNDVGECKDKKGCGYSYSPFNYFRETNSIPVPVIEPSYIENSYFLKSLNHQKENNFFIYLSKQLGEIKASKAMNEYLIGTSKLHPGAPIFWLIDSDNKKRTGRIVQLDKETGKCCMSLWQSTGWVHRLINLPKFNAVACLFGEHLLKIEPDKPIVIVSHEKIAVIGSCLYPEYLWLAMGFGDKAVDRKTLQTLSGRNVIWFPSKGFDKLNEFIE